MPRKSSSKTTAKKFTAVPPKAAVAAPAPATKPIATAIPTPAVTFEKTVAAKPAETKIEAAPVVTAAKTATATIAVAKTECCHGAASSESCTDHSATVAAAITGLLNENADTARDAATALGTLADRSAVEPLIQALNNTCGFFHSVVRAAAAESLGALGDDRAVEPLLTAITDPIAEVSSESIRAVSRFNTTTVVEALSDVVRNRTNFFLPVARQAAVFGLAKLGGDRASEILRSVAADEFEDSTIRTAAESGLTPQAATSAK